MTEWIGWWCPGCKAELIKRPKDAQNIYRCPSCGYAWCILRIENKYGRNNTK